jgi:ATP-dependent DNA helicase RecG
MSLMTRLLESLPFRLTSSQERALEEILADMERPVPMSRLQQGDVGSGKTVVALLAAMVPLASGYQAAMMAPTELLAEQHYGTVYRLVSGLGVRVALLTGRQKPRARSEILTGVAAGAVDLLVGTHALLEEKVRFARLGLIVVDEQHRFGVMQRASLMEKGKSPDVLVMTATPIPRTLALTVYGDLDASTLREMPSGRGEVRTRVTMESNREKVYEFLAERLHEGRQAFVVYPLIEESERVDLRAAVRMVETMRRHPLFRETPIELLHGRMTAEAKSEIMGRFVGGKVSVLVSTTVVEVGIDVPNASVMIVEHAERYGLSQLHQLRGRIGRGTHRSTCILIRSEDVGEGAARRLAILESTRDGFEIAEADLELRGPGEFFGTRQHGGVEFRIANPARDQELLMEARREAFEMIARDAGLRDPAHRPVLEALGGRYREKARLFDVG